MPFMLAMNNQSIGAAENKLSLITMILAHLQLLFWSDSFSENLWRRNGCQQHV